MCSSRRRTWRSLARMPRRLDEIVTLNQARVRSGDVAEVELLRSRIAALQSQQAVRSADLKCARNVGVWSVSSGVRPAATVRDPGLVRSRRRLPTALPIWAHAPFAHDPTSASAGSTRAIAGRNPSAARTGADRLHDRRGIPPAGGPGRPRQLAGPLLQRRRCRYSIAIRATSRAPAKRNGKPTCGSVSSNG